MTQNPSQKLYIRNEQKLKEFLRGYLESYCDTVHDLVKQNSMDENDISAKVAKKLELFLSLTTEENDSNAYFQPKRKIRFYDIVDRKKVEYYF